MSRRNNQDDLHRTKDIKRPRTVTDLTERPDEDRANRQTDQTPSRFRKRPEAS